LRGFAVRTTPAELPKHPNYQTNKLLRFAVLGVLPAARAVLVELQPIGIVAAILLGRVIPFLAVITLECDDRSDVLLLGSHLEPCFPVIQ
jgi:hypothetical protein